MEQRLCQCHGQPMIRYQSIRYKPGGKSQPYYWRCRVKYNEWQARRRKAHPERIKQWSRNGRLKKFGITEEEYQRMFNEQGGVCAICSGLPDGQWSMLAVDHNHDTGVVRGLLCMTCNTMLGRLEARLNKTLNYLGLTI